MLKITRSDCFMNMSTHCEGNVSVEWLKSIIELNKTIKKPLNIPLSNYCYQTQYGLYRFSDLWYDGLSDNGIPYKTTKKKNGQVILTKLRTLDFYTDKINSLIVLKKNKSNLIVMATEDLIFNDTKLFAGIPYQINYMVLARESNPGEEYFMQKSIMDFIPSFEDEMKLKLKNLIDD